MAKQKLLILTCDDGFFGQGIKVWKSMDVERMKKLFQDYNYDIIIQSYEYVAKNIKDFYQYIVVYSSTQKPGYKGFLEDVLLGLIQQDNKLVPRFDFFRAHENKGYQEIMRQICGIEAAKGWYFSGSRDLQKMDIEFPVVYKTTQGAKSSGVSLEDSKAKLVQKIKNQERLSFYWQIHRAVKKILSPKLKSTIWHEYITPRHRFVLQRFVPDQNFDYKVMVFGKKYFVLKRDVRKNDFRASGSGKLKFVDADDSLLNYAYKIFYKLECPFLSMDICKTESGYALIEFQGVHFGPYTIINASSYYEHKSNSWNKINQI